MKHLYGLAGVDRKVEFQLADEEMITQLFCVVFKHSEGSMPCPRKLQSRGLLEEDKTVEEDKIVEGDKIAERLAKEFAARVSKLEHSPAEILSFLLEHKQSPKEAINSVEPWATRIMEDKKKAKAPTIRNSRQLSRAPICTPPSSPDIPSSHLSTTGDAHHKDLEKALTAIQTTPPTTPICSCSQTALNSPTFQASSQPVTFENLKQLFLEVIQTKTESSGSTEVAGLDNPGASEQVKTEIVRASTLDLETVNE